MTYELKIDQPLTNPKDDILGRVKFSQEITNSIIKLNVQGGFVYGLYGAWGTGKSTVINFLDSEIETYNNQNQSKNRVIIFRFSPWMISNTEHLVSSFLQQLRVRLGMSDARKIFNSLSSKLEIFEGALAVVNPLVSFIPIPGMVGVLQGIQQAASSAKKQFKDIANYLEKDLHHIKDEIIKVLNKQNNKILVIIDDLDRLHADEIRDIFRLIKGVCDFPKMIYLIACDHEKVSKAISNNEEDVSYGYNYLEKIIQCPIHIPPIDKQKLHKQFFRDLELIIPSFENEEFYENTDLYNIQICIVHVLKTMRDSTRFLNSIASCYPLVKDEVNIADFIAIQAIKVFSPLTYETIQNNKSMFISSKNEQDELKRNRKKFFSELDKSVPKEILEIIFPAFDTSDTSWIHSHRRGDYSDWLRCRRLCTEEYFDMYFTLSLADNNFSMAERSAIIALSENPEKLKERFRELEQQGIKEGETKFGIFLSDMIVCVKDIPSDYLSNFLQALCHVSDEIKGYEDGFFKHMLMVGISLEIINRIEPNKRHSVLTKLVEKSESISLTMAIVDHFLEKNKNHSGKNNEIDDLKSISVNKIKASASKKTLKNNPHLSYLLCKWLDWGESSEVKEYVKTLIEKDDSLITLIGGVLSTIRSYQDEPKVDYKISEDSLKKILDDDQILSCIQRCEKLILKNKKPTEQERKILIACENMLKSKNDNHIL